MGDRLEWISTKKSMEILGFRSRTTLYKFLYKYRVRVTKPMGKTYINYDDLMNGLSSGTVIMGE
jgi:hypothetical protein